MIEDFNQIDNQLQQEKSLSTADVIRDGLIDHVSEILRECDQISESFLRLKIQASCLDLLTTLEDVISERKLDSGAMV